MDVRRVTNDIINAVEDGFLDWEEVARAALKYMSEDEVEDMARLNDWLIADDEDLEEDLDIEFDEEYDDDEIHTLTEEEALDMFLQGQVLFINNNDGYTAIVPLNRLDDENAYTRIDYDFGQKLIDIYDLQVYERTGPGPNQEIYIFYDEESNSSDRFDEDFDSEEYDDDKILTRADYDKLDFHKKNLLIGDVDIYYPELEVMNQFDDVVGIDYTYTAYVTPAIVIDYICEVNKIDKNKLTIKQAQQFIDELAKNPQPFYEFLEDEFVEEAEKEAAEYVMEYAITKSGKPFYFSENLDQIEEASPVNGGLDDEPLGNNYDKIDFYNNELYGDLEIPYESLEFEIIPKTAIDRASRYDADEPAYVYAESIRIPYEYNTYVDVDDIIDYIYDTFDFDPDTVTVKQFQSFVDEVAKNPEKYLQYLADKYEDDAIEAAEQEYEETNGYHIDEYDRYRDMMD